jgi:hypothetical protein
MKSETINQLEEELRRIKETHANMIKTYEAKLGEFGIPVEEIGFEPLLPVNEVKTIENPNNINNIQNSAGNSNTNMNNNITNSMNIAMVSPTH